MMELLTGFAQGREEPELIPFFLMSDLSLTLQATQLMIVNLFEQWDPQFNPTKDEPQNSEL